MRALVVSGGGSMGAWGGGVAEYLHSDNKTYDIYIGTSTGALMTPILAVGDMERLKKAYTNVSSNDVFKMNPFKVKKDGSFRLNYVGILWRLLKGNSSFGDSSRLRKSIATFFKHEDYLEIKKNKNVLCCVSNIDYGCVEYKDIKQCTYEDYLDWMYASASVYPFMQCVNKEGYKYADGGYLEHVPIQRAVNMGATEIDVIIHKTQNRIYKPIKDNLSSILVRLLEMMHDEIGRGDVKVENIHTRGKQVRINIYYMSRKLTNNSLIFNKRDMLSWWEQGKNDFFFRQPERIIIGENTK